MSPEQLRGADPAPAADLYSLGCTVFQLLTGRLPFEGGTEFEVAEAHLHRLPPDPRRLRPECPHWLAAFVLRLLEKRPAARWPDAAAAARALARRRWLTTPRFRRRLGAAAAALVIGATLIFFLLQRRPVPAQVTVGGDTVTVTDREGRTLWTVRSAGRVESACVADFFGEGRPQVAIGEVVPTAIADRRAGRILIYGADGRERLVLQLEDHAQEDFFPDLNPTTAAVTLLAADLDGDGLDELAYFTEHDPWYPSRVGVWLPRSGIRPRELLTNSGRVAELKAADLDGDGANELLATGTNNPLGYQPFLAIVWRFNRDQPKYSARGTASPDHLALYARPDDPVRPEFPYTLMGVGSQPLIVFAGPDGIEVELRTTRRRVRLDADANPAGSPLSGRGTAPRVELWRSVAEACIAAEGNKISGREAISRVLEGGSPALAEAPMRAAAELLLARSIARSGDHATAIGLLAAACRRDPELTDLSLRLGELLVVSGRTEEGWATLHGFIGAARTGRSASDPALWLQLVAALEGDRAAFDHAETLFATATGAIKSPLATDLRAVWAFNRGDWTDLSLDGEGATPYYPIAAALRRWAELERGAALADIITAARDLAVNPERRELATLLEARAEIAEGNPERALGLAQRALETLERRGRAELEMYVWTPLAHRLVADALLALSRPADARPHLARAQALAPKCWFGVVAAPDNTRGAR